MSQLRRSIPRPASAALPAAGILLLAALPAAALPTPERWGVHGPVNPLWEEIVHGDRKLPIEGAAGAGADMALKHLQECIGGNAGGYACNNVDLYELVPLATMAAGGGNDLWGWTDPMTGNEYALMGLDNGTAFVDVTDPEEPVYLGKLPTHSSTSIWRDIKVYADHAFIVSEAPSHGMQVFDLTQLRSVASPPQTFAETAFYGEFGRTHNIVINEDSGFAYAVGSTTCGAGLHMIDISDPVNPTSAGCFSGDGYTHDAQCVNYVGPDAEHVGKEICLASNEDTLTIVDVTDKGNPVQLSRTGYAGAGYTHQGWLTEDQAYFLLDDEGDESNLGHDTRTYVWDVSDLDQPVVVGHHDATTSNTDHNQYVLGSFTYQANYGAGLRILKLGDLAAAELTEVAFFDTSLAWSVYPYFASGTVILSDINEGLFVLRQQLCMVPAAPASLAAVADGDNQIELTWSGGTPETTVNVYRAFGTCPGSDFELVAAGVAGNSFQDPVSGQVDYAYQVTHSDETGLCESPASGCASASTTGACTAPPLFAGLDRVFNQAAESCALTLSWPAASPNCGGGATYTVYRSTDPAFLPAPEDRIVVGLTGTSWTDLDVLPGESYTYVVRATDLGNGTEDGNLEAQTATATGPLGDGTLSAGAEVGDPFLPSYNGSANLTGGDAVKNHIGWELSEARQHSGVRSYFSTYANGQCSSLSTPPLELTAGQSSTLSFWTVYDIEFEWDGGVVQISDDGGDTWQQLALSPDYPGTFNNSGDACGFIDGTPSITGENQLAVWTEYTADLSAFAGEEIQIRWTFSTNGDETHEGWYVDDVSVTHAQVPGTCVSGIVFFDGFESGGTGSWSSATP